MFVNNASIGWYAEMLQTRARLSRRMPRQLAKVAALLAHLPKAPRFDVEVAGETYKSWLVWVGNGRYDLTRRPPDRARLAHRSPARCPHPRRRPAAGPLPRRAGRC